jgi:hypothetical protein
MKTYTEPLCRFIEFYLENVLLASAAGTGTGSDLESPLDMSDDDYNNLF